MHEQSTPENALELVDARRRGFLTNLLAGGAVAAALPAMSTVALGAENGSGAGKGKGGKGKGGGGKGKGAGGNRDPQAMAARMIQEYDRDGDGALNARELANALTAMAQRRGGQGNQGAGKGGAGKGKGGAGKGKGQGGAPGGGVKPNRPNAE